MFFSTRRRGETPTPVASDPALLILTRMKNTSTCMERLVVDMRSQLKGVATNCSGNVPDEGVSGSVVAASESEAPGSETLAARRAVNKSEQPCAGSQTASTKAEGIDVKPISVAADPASCDGLALLSFLAASSDQGAFAAAKVKAAAEAMIRMQSLLRQPEQPPPSMEMHTSFRPNTSPSPPTSPKLLPSNAKISSLPHFLQQLSSAPYFEGENSSATTSTDLVQQRPQRSANNNVTSPVTTFSHAVADGSDEEWGTEHAIRRISSESTNGINKRQREDLEEMNGRRRDHICPSCGKQFLRKQDLSRHEATHSTMKAFLCPNGCGTSFGRSDAMSRHLKAKRCRF